MLGSKINGSKEYNVYYSGTMGRTVVNWHRKKVNSFLATFFAVQILPSINYQKVSSKAPKFLQNL